MLIASILFTCVGNDWCSLFRASNCYSWLEVWCSLVEAALTSIEPSCFGTIWQPVLVATQALLPTAISLWVQVLRLLQIWILMIWFVHHSTFFYFCLAWEFLSWVKFPIAFVALYSKTQWAWFNKLVLFPPLPSEPYISWLPLILW